MNKAFKNSIRIELDSNWFIESDGDNGVILTFREIRERVNKKTEEKEEYMFEDKFYYPRIAQALRAYVNKALNNSSSIQEIVEKEDLILSLIDKIDKEFKQF